MTVLFFPPFFVGLLVLLLPPKTFSFTQDMLREKRETLTRRRLSLWERLAIRVYMTVKNAGFTPRSFALLLVAAFLAGMGAGAVLFGGFDLALATGLAFLPLPYIILSLKSQKTARRELESLENTMSVITNGFIGADDIVQAFVNYVKEKNQHREPHQIQVTPFDEFVSEVLLINPDIERALLALEAKIRNPYFSDWIKMLMLAYRTRELKFALQPIVKAMGDAKAMQIECDTQMAAVWRDYVMTVALMFAIIPILRFANADWYTILTTTPVGKLFIVLMLVMALVSAFIVTRITKPIKTD